MCIDMILCGIIDAEAIFRWFFANASYLMVFLLMTVESSFIPFPSEVIVPPAAFLAASNMGAGAEMNLVGVVIAATLGAMCGAFINYYLSLWIGRPLIFKFADSRLAHALMINREKVERSEKFFAKHGAVSTFIGRLIPAVRQLISIPAGLARMNVGQFAIFTVLGALIWNAILATLGAWLATFVTSESELFAKVEQYNGYLSVAGYALLGLCILYMAYKAFTAKRPTKN